MGENGGVHHFCSLSPASTRMNTAAITLFFLMVAAAFAFAFFRFSQALWSAISDSLRSPGSKILIGIALLFTGLATLLSTLCGIGVALAGIVALFQELTRLFQ